LLVLERGQVTRLGDNKARPAAPKLVAATNQDLAALVRQGRFRNDLYMRLDPAMRLRVPPLRERREDLPELVRFVLVETLRSEGLRPLVRQYLARFPTVRDFHDGASAVFFGRPKATEATPDGFSVFLSRAALSHLAEHDWPGNVRELRYTLRRAAALSDGAIDGSALGLEPPAPFPSACEVRLASRAADAPEYAPPLAGLARTAPTGAESDVLALAGKTFEEMQNAIFRWALRRNRGSRRRAAMALGISRSTFCDRVRKLGLAESRE
jgi:two-component system nitrogen regulation response regulator GlnG